MARDARAAESRAMRAYPQLMAVNFSAEHMKSEVKYQAALHRIIPSPAVRSFLRTVQQQTLQKLAALVLDTLDDRTRRHNDWIDDPLVTNPVNVQREAMLQDIYHELVQACDTMDEQLSREQSQDH
jgi:hypothetical protein